MKSVPRYLVILLLLVVALPSIVNASSSNATPAAAASSTPTLTASYDWTMTPAPIANIPTTISSFFTCVFGVRIFPGADPVGAYSINVNPNYVPDTMSGKVSGHMFLGPGSITMPDMIFYLYDTDSGTSGSYYAITDSHGYYVIDRVPFGNYSVYYCNDKAAMHAGNGELAGSVNLTASNPNAVVDGRIMLG